MQPAQAAGLAQFRDRSQQWTRERPTQLAFPSILCLLALCSHCARWPCSVSKALQSATLTSRTTLSCCFCCLIINFFKASIPASNPLPPPPPLISPLLLVTTSRELISIRWILLLESIRVRKIVCNFTKAYWFVFGGQIQNLHWHRTNIPCYL